MAFSARIIADSISALGHRITTFILMLPRIMLAELNTHRMLSKNSASSRAKPTRKVLVEILRNTFIPHKFGTAVSGMQAGPPLEGEQDELARQIWFDSSRSAIYTALTLYLNEEVVMEEWMRWVEDVNDDFDEFVLEIADRIEKKDKRLVERQGLLQVSKGIVNRVLEPYSLHEVILTGTEWENMINLRTHKDAQEEIQAPARLIRDAFDLSEPRLVNEGEWHMPFIAENELELVASSPEMMRMVSAARCARISYISFDELEPNLEKDIDRARMLAASGHMSPFEHVATPLTAAEMLVRAEMAEVVRESDLDPSSKAFLINATEMSANVRGWKQLRRDFPNERVYIPSAA